MSRSASFKSLENWQRWAALSVCSCASVCLPGQKNATDESGVICNKIPLLGSSSFDSAASYVKEATQALELFLAKGILLKSLGKLYIAQKGSAKVSLHWENIKSLGKELASIKESLWLFRKFVVDSLIRAAWLKSSSNKEDFRIYSVGSTKVTSDYDVTVYHPSAARTSALIREFHVLFQDIFNDKSSAVFDTNLYGQAPMQFVVLPEEKSLWKWVTPPAVCKSQKEEFAVLRADPAYADSQLVWALVKFLGDLAGSQGVEIADDFAKYIAEFCPHAKMAQNLLEFFHNDCDERDKYYDKALRSRQHFLEVYRRHNLSAAVAITDHISLVNFFGNETYLTRGAFVETVINAQLCRGEEAVPPSSDDRIQSILENAGFYFVHSNKTKYIDRVVASLEALAKEDKKYSSVLELPVYQKFKSEYTAVCKGQKDEICEKKYCDWIHKGMFDLTTCEKFRWYQVVLQVCSQLLKIRRTSEAEKAELQKNVCPFYKLFVLGEERWEDVRREEEGSTEVSSVLVDVMF